MPYRCSGICERFKARLQFGVSPYKNGAVKCSICDFWINTEGCLMVNERMCCVCCKSRVRRNKH